MVTTRAGNAPTGDRRVRRTHAALQRALILLVEERELSQLSVADVAEHAGVSRSTFYDHYRDVHELAEAACTAMIDDLISSLPGLDPGPADQSQDRTQDRTRGRSQEPTATQDPTQSLRAFFADLAEHAGLYRSLLGPQGSARVVDHVRRRIIAAIQDASPAAVHPLDVPAAFTAGALIGVATEWLEHGCSRTPDEMAALVWPLLAALHHADPCVP